MEPTTAPTTDFSCLRLIADRNLQKTQNFLLLAIEGLTLANPTSEFIAQNSSLSNELHSIVFPPHPSTPTPSLLPLSNFLFIENKYFKAKLKIHISDFDHCLSKTNLSQQSPQKDDGIIFFVTQEEIACPNFRNVITSFREEIGEVSMSLLFIETDQKKEIDLEEFYGDLEIYIESTSDDVEGFDWGVVVRRAEEEKKKSYDDKEGVERLVELLQNTTWPNYEKVQAKGKTEAKEEPNAKGEPKAEAET
jgi:hypothetical protein